MITRKIAAALALGLSIPAITALPSFAANYVVSDPLGTLLTTATLTIPLDASEFRVRGNGEHELDGNNTCGLSSGLHVYDVQSIDVTIAGEYTFRTIATSSNQTEAYPDPWHGRNEEGFTGMHPIEDAFVAIYSNGFNPNDPDSSVVGCNDDSTEYWEVVDANDGGTEFQNVDTPSWGGTWVWGTDDITVNGNPVSTKMPTFTTYLEVGHYTALVTVFPPMTADWWNAGDDNDQFQWTAGPAGVQTEIWGPVGGATLSDTEWEIVSTNPELAATGAEGSTGTAIIAFLGLAAGILMRSRKKIA
jgi:hypothetical protein